MRKIIEELDQLKKDVSGITSRIVKIENLVKDDNKDEIAENLKNILTFSDYFDIGSMKGWRTSEISKKQYRIVDGALEIRRNKGDKKHAGGFRAEIQRKRVSVDAEEWYGFDLMIPESVNLNPGTKKWVHVAQWHATPDKKHNEPWRRPPLSIVIRQGQFFVESSYDILPKSTATSPVRNPHIVVGPVNQGEFSRWVLHIQWDWSGEKSILEVWKDGYFIGKHNLAIGYNDSNGTYFKMGIYNSEDAFTPWISYIKNVRISDHRGSFEAVA